MSEDGTPWDALVIGAGPTGLTAAVYLARFRRRVLVLSSGPSRADWIPESHNTPGFPQGISGPALVARLRSQAEAFGAELRSGFVDGLTETPDGFRAHGPFGAVAGHTVLMTTGVRDVLPPIANLDDAIRASVVRMCPICDGYEAIGRRLAVLGDGELAHREADFLRQYSDDVEVLILDDANPEVEGLRVSPGDLQVASGSVSLARPGGARIFDHLYLALGCNVHAELAVAAGARQDEVGKLIVDAHQMTSVQGLYAAGDVVRGLNQIAVGAGEAAIAATAIHNRLRERR